MVNNLPHCFKSIDEFLQNHSECIILKNSNFYYYSKPKIMYTDKYLPYYRFVDKEELLFLTFLLGEECISSSFKSQVKIHNPNFKNYITKTAPLYEYGRQKTHYIVNNSFTTDFPDKQTVEDARLFYSSINIDVIMKIKRFRQEKMERDFQKNTVDQMSSIVFSLLKRDDIPDKYIVLSTIKRQDFNLYFLVKKSSLKYHKGKKILFNIPPNYNEYMRGKNDFNIKKIAMSLSTTFTL